MTSYLLDTNVFIQAKNLHYGMDFCPAFWEWLKVKNRDGQVFSIEKPHVKFMHPFHMLRREKAVHTRAITIRYH